MQVLKAILVDDELNSLQNLQLKIQEYCPSIRVVAQTQRPEEAITLIQQHKPDVIFLDIEMPRMSGFKMLEEIPDIDFEIIFITAYNHYAINAIRISAFDYLVKPVAIEDLQETVERLGNFTIKKTRERAEILKKNLANPKSQEDHIAIPTNDGLEFIQIKQMIRIESSSNYSKIVLLNGQHMLVTGRWKILKKLFKDNGFHR